MVVHAVPPIKTRLDDYSAESRLWPAFSRRGLIELLVPDELRKCVVFLGIKKEDGTFLPRATAFCVSHDEQTHRFFYLVTAEHVVSGLLSRGHEIFARYNTASGIVNEGPIPADIWTYHPDTEHTPTDVAIAPFWPRPDLDVKMLQLTAGAENECACTEDVIKEYSIGPGEEVVSIGLFRSHHGVERAIPVVRVGHLSVMREEPVHTSYCGYMDAYLVELMSIGGLSGSPVFVNMAPARIVEGRLGPSPKKQFYLLGLMHGHFDVKNLNEDVVTDSDGASLGSINAGLGVVVPVEKILETVMHPDLKKLRDKGIKKARESGAKPDVALDDSPPANGENPTHREDFMRLVGAAARKPAPKG